MIRLAVAIFQRSIAARQTIYGLLVCRLLCLSIFLLSQILSVFLSVTLTFFVISYITLDKTTARGRQQSNGQLVKPANAIKITIA